MRPIHGKVGPVSLSCASLILTLSLLAVLPAAGPFAYASHGIVGIQATMIAAGVCWLGAFGGLLIVAAFLKQPSSGMLFAMAPRTGIPFVVGLVLDRIGGPLANAGVFGWMVVFFLFALIVQTLLSLAMTRTRGQVETRAS